MLSLRNFLWQVLFVFEGISKLKEIEKSINKKLVWITGLSGSGKSTIAESLTALLKKKGMKVILLDGDEIRNILVPIREQEQSYTKNERIKLAIQYSKLGNLLVKQGFMVIIATISLFKEVHIWNRKNIKGYFEVYLKVPLEELQRRDPKKIYSRFNAGELKNVAGLDLDIDEPRSPDWVVNCQLNKNVPDIALELMNKLYSR